MKSLVLAASAAAVLAIAAPAVASAETTGYLNLGYAAIDGNGVNLGAVQGRLGAQFNPYLGIEGEVAFGAKKDGGDKLSNEYGVYGVVKYPVNENFDIFARAGMARAEAKGPGGSLKDDGAAYGVGAQYTFDGKNGVRADYTKYSFGGDADVWSVSYVRKF